MIINVLDIKAEREKLGMTQDEFANLLGVSRKTITNYESGGNIPETKANIYARILSNYTPEVTKNYTEPLNEYNEELSRYKAKDLRELRDIAYRFLANEDDLYNNNLLPDNREMHFWIRYEEIVNKFGSVENYLNKEV